MKTRVDTRLRCGFSRRHLFSLLSLTLVLLVAATAAAAPASTPLAAPGDEYWADDFVLNGVTGNRAMAVSGDNVFVGGDSITAGRFKADNVAVWNRVSRTWAAAGAGLDWPVSALAVDNNGSLYAAGYLTYGAWTTVGHLAKFNPAASTWSTLGDALDGQVWELAVDGSGNVYVAGDFTHAGAVAASHIAKWNAAASTWTALGPGLDGSVYALAVDKSGNLYAGGRMKESSAAFLVKWNGSTWSSLNAVLGSCWRHGQGSYSYISALAVDASGDVYASGCSADILSMWDHSTGTWSSIVGALSWNPSPETSIDALLVDNAGNLYAGGRFTQIGPFHAHSIARWNKTTRTWYTLGNGMDAQVTAAFSGGVSGLALDNLGYLYAAGQFSTAGGAVASHIARWDGNTWSGLAGINATTSRPIYDLVARGGDLYVAGVFATAGDRVANGVAKWGGAWSSLGSGMSGGRASNPYDTVPNTEVNALAVDSKGTLYAAGNFTDAGGTPVCHVAGWDGNAWSDLDSPFDCGGYGSPSDDMVVDQDDNLYVGINVRTAATGAWSSLGGGVSGLVYALAARGNDIYVGGSFTTAGGVTVNGIARWDRTLSKWFALGTGVTGTVQTLAVDGAGNVYAGGTFDSAGGVPAKNIAVWNAAARSWSALGDPGGSVNVLAIDSRGNVFAGGEFATDHILKWNGSTWERLGSGVNGVVRALAVQGNNLWVGGDFTTAGGHPSAYLARWAVAPTAFDFTKRTGQNSPLALTASDFLGHFTGAGSSHLVKVKITSLPSHGTLTLNGSPLPVNAEIAVASLGGLVFTPEKDWLGTETFAWNGYDGTGYAPTQAYITIRVLVLYNSYFPFVPVP